MDFHILRIMPVLKGSAIRMPLMKLIRARIMLIMRFYIHFARRMPIMNLSQWNTGVIGSDVPG